MNSAKNHQVVAECGDFGARKGDKCYFGWLPIELQTQIFIECLQDRFARFKRTEAPITLLAVCRSWSILALSVPQLWSSFELCLEGSGNSKTDKRTLAELNAWLERSNKRPLSFKVTYKPSMTSLQSSADPIPATILSVLSRYSHRWRHVEFYVSTACLTSLLESSPHDLTTLDSISIDAACGTTKLLDVRSLGIKWNQLTALRLNLDPEHLPDLDDCLVILSESVHLSSCVLSANCVLRNLHGEDRVVLPCLEEFRIVLHDYESLNGRPESSLVSFLNKLEPIMLKALHIEWLVRIHADPASWSTYHPEFMKFIEHLSPTLETLQLSYLPMLESHLVQCLSFVPYLTSLDFRCSLGDAAHDPVTNAFLTRLSFLNEFETCSRPSTLLPLLRSVNLICHGEAWSPPIIIRFIDSRIRLGHLRQFKLKMSRPTPECIGTQITDWQKAGISVAFQSVTF